MNRTDKWAIVGAGALGLAILAVRIDREPPVPEQKVAGRPIAVPKGGYTSSTTCRACHAREYSTWHDSYHRKMTQVVDPDGVIGDFDGVTLRRFDNEYRLERRGDEFWIDMPDPMTPPGPRQPRVQRRVSMTTGSHHMQLYWYESGHSRVTGLLPFAFLRDEQTWIPRFAAFVLPPSTEVSAEFGQWGLVCIKCHATHGRPLMDMEGRTVRGADTHVSEFGIACEACHGPAEDHVAENHDPTHRYAMHLTDEPDSTMVNPARLPHRRSTQVCGQCHGNFDDIRRGDRAREWLRNGFAYRPGDDLEETRKVLRSGWDEQFWSDGVVRVAGREYNGLVGSGCYERGEMSCVSCHVLHKATDDPRPTSEWANDQLGYGMDGDQACLQCHESYRDDVPAHTHHPAGSAGSRCYNCHMPFTSYGLLKGIRNHRIRSPSVLTTVETGRPNACNQCHLDKTLQWSAEHLEGWYGIEQPTLSVDDRTVAASVSWALRGDAAQRALCAWNLGWDAAHEASGTEWIAPYLAELLDDPYEAVRIIAQRSLRRLPGYGDFHGGLTGTPAERADERARVRARWRETMTGAPARQREALLIGADGALLEDPFARLLKLRDNRPVRLLE